VLIEIVKVDWDIQDDPTMSSITSSPSREKGWGGPGSIQLKFSPFRTKDLTRLGRFFADKHQFMVGLPWPRHKQPPGALGERRFSFAKHNTALNVDLGHFVAGNNVSPVPFIKRTS